MIDELALGRVSCRNRAGFHQTVDDLVQVVVIRPHQSEPAHARSRVMASKSQAHVEVPAVRLYWVDR